MNTVHDDGGLRRLLDDAVAGVEPRPGLDAIRARTTSAPARARRPWAWGLGGAVLAAAATLAVVGALGDLPDLTGTTDGATGAASGSTSAAPSTGPLRTVYFLATTASGVRLFPEQHRTGSGPGEALTDAVTDAVTGRASDPDYRSGWPTGSTVAHARLDGDTLTVDLGGPVVARPDGMTSDQAAAAVQQLVWTAQSVSGRRLPVRFLHDGAATPTLLGQPASEPVPAASADDVLASVTVAAPVDGSSVTSPFTVTGRAATYEADVQWELRSGSTVVRKGFTTARTCCTLSPYSFTVSAPPGDYTLVVHDEDVSDGEGVAPSQDTKNLTVR